MKRLVLELVLEHLPLGYVHHRAEHPDRTALSIVNDIAAIYDERISAVMPLEPVRIGPIVLTTVDVTGKVGQNPVGILRVKTAFPRFDIGTHPPACVAEHFFKPFVPP